MTQTLGMNSEQRITGNDRRTSLRGAGDLAAASVVAAESALAQQPHDGQPAYGECQATGAKITTSVHDVTYDLLRRHGITTVFGNPGSNELYRTAARLPCRALLQELALQPSTAPCLAKSTKHSLKTQQGLLRQ